MNIQYDNFRDELNKYFHCAANIVTEDLIRHLFIKIHKTCAEIKDGVEIEMPYRELLIKEMRNGCLSSDRARADLYFGDTDDTVFEFKYHRQTKYSNNCTATKMGSVFRDLNRLSILDNKEKYLIYVFDEKMKNYYEDNSPFNILKMSTVKVGDILKVNGTIDELLADGYAEFKQQAFSGFTYTEFAKFDYTIKVVYKEKLANDYNLLIFKVD